MRLILHIKNPNRSRQNLYPVTLKNRQNKVGVLMDEKNREIEIPPDGQFPQKILLIKLEIEHGIVRFLS